MIIFTHSKTHILCSYFRFILQYFTTIIYGKEKKKKRNSTRIKFDNTATNIIQSLEYLDANELKRSICCTQNMET